jgi:hypothetical protein
MSLIPSRRSRTVDSDDEQEESRAGTPASVGRNDTKRSRRSRDDEDTPSSSTPQHGVAPGLSSAPKSSNGKQAVAKGATKLKSKYQPGAILRVKLTNFVTYSSVEFFPGPNLNMVIGPNGTGKSTLVCAICLGLGWGPKVCRRTPSCLIS